MSRSLLVVVTGATGFVGSHTVRALTARGHRVRLFVRSPDKAQRVFGAAMSSLEVARGDITDAGSVAAALQGADALVHAAALVAIDRKSAARVHRTNLSGTENVLGAAREANLERIVHVSSASALFTPGLRHIDESTPLAEGSNAYGRSKSAADRYARSLQDAGAPLHITYPAAIVGPEDPGESEGNHALRIFGKWLMPLTSSGFQAIDVRDLAEMHARLVEHAGPADRFVVGGHYLPWRQLRRVLKRETGRTGVPFPSPGWVYRAFGVVGDGLCRVGLENPITVESTDYATRWPVVSNDKACSTLGVKLRPIEHTIADTLRVSA